MESGKSLLGAGEGVVMARDFRSKPESGSGSNVEGFDKFEGAPWGPYPEAKRGFEMRSKVRLPVESGEFTKTVMGKGEFAPRRFRVRREDLEKRVHDRMPGMQSGEQGHDGGGARGGVQKTIAEEPYKFGDESLECEKERLFDYPEEENSSEGDAEHVHEGSFVERAGSIARRSVEKHLELHQAQETVCRARLLRAMELRKGGLKRKRARDRAKSRPGRRRK
jgi:hypothetical protein